MVTSDILEPSKNEELDVIKFALENLIDTSGELRLENVDGNLSSLFIYHDLGDITPFLVHLGEDGFINGLLGKVSEVIARDGGLISGSPSLGRFHGFSKSYEYSDFLLGLEDCNRTIGSEQSRELLLSQIEDAEKKFRFRGRHSSYYSNRFRLHIPIVDTRDTMFIEVYCDLWKSLRDEKYLQTAIKLFDDFTRLRLEDNLGLLPDFHMNSLLQRLLGLRPNYTLMKNQTNSLQAYLRLYDETKEHRVLKEVDSLFANVIQNFQLGKGQFSDSISRFGSEVSLKASFAVIEFVIEYQLVTRDARYLQYAIDIADFWRSKIGSTGLFPMTSKSSISFIDSQTDMVISLWRLGALTNDNNTLALGDLAFAALRLHHAQKSFPLNVDVNSGEVANTTIRTKFVFLYLKTLIALRVRNSQIQDLNNDLHYRRLLRDR